MANFSTHVLGALGAGVVATAILASADLLPLESVASGIGLVALGGISPDVDSDHSDAILLVFDTLALAVAVPVSISLVPEIGLLLGLVLLAGIWLFLRYVAIQPFRHLTVHRGRIHSLPMAAMLGAGIATICATMVDPMQAWILGGLFTLGFLVHLTLDEAFSVDLSNRRMKKSFGTAIKVIDRDDLLGYGFMYAALLAILVVAPSPRPLLHAVAHAHLRLLPSQRVMELFAER